jgi:hypothetical protein
MYIKQLKMALNEKSGQKDEEYKVKVIALRTTSNIHTLIKVSFNLIDLGYMVFIFVPMLVHPISICFVIKVVSYLI